MLIKRFVKINPFLLHYIKVHLLQLFGSSSEPSKQSLVPSHLFHKGTHVQKPYWPSPPALQPTLLAIH